jgi:hypothetical protein
MPADHALTGMIAGDFLQNLIDDPMRTVAVFIVFSVGWVCCACGLACVLTVKSPRVQERFEA